MRRSDRQVCDLDAIRALLDAQPFLHLALRAEGAPYVLPMNYGYELTPEGGLTLYLHSAPQGRKLELLRRDPRVGFAISRQEALVPAGTPCGWTARYRSLVGAGAVRVLATDAEKKRALDALMRHLGHEGPTAYDGGALDRVCALCVEVETYTCKSNLPAKGAEA